MGEGGGDLWDFFTASGDDGEGVKRMVPLTLPSPIKGEGLIDSNPSVTRIEEASEPVTQGFSPDLSALKG